MRSYTSIAVLVVLCICLHYSSAYVRPSQFMGKWLQDYDDNVRDNKRHLASPALAIMSEREMAEHVKRGAARCDNGKVCYGECCGRDRCCKSGTTCQYVGTPYWQAFFCD